MSRHTWHIRRIAGLLAVLLVGTAGAAPAQNAVLRGTVRSDIGELIEGASVVIPEMAFQTATSARGVFLISIPEARVRGQAVTLVVRMIGFRPYRQALTVRAGEHVFDATLQSDVNRLEDIVVTGVMEGTPQTQTTFSVDRVDLTNVRVPSVDPLTQLAGRVPGVLVNTSTGRPGASADIMLRGPTSINASGRSQEPLYIVDGVIISGGLPSINTQDIENIEVVKGAAGASLYGARAANGVINITTKSGRTAAEGTTLHMRTEVGASDVEREIQLARQHALLTDATGERFCIRDTSQPLCARTVDWIAETNRVNNAPGGGAADPETFTLDPGVSTPAPTLRQVFLSRQWPVPLYDAVSQVLTSQPFVSTNIEATGRAGGTRYFASASQLRQKGAVRMMSGFERYTARLNVDQQVRANMSLSFRTFYSRGNWDGWSQDGGGNLFFRLTRQPASVNVLAHDTLGRLFARSNIMFQGRQNNNPLMFTTGNGITDLTTNDRFIGGGTLRWTMTGWADLEANFSYDNATNYFDYGEPKGFRSNIPTDLGFVGRVWTMVSGGSSYNASVNLTLRHNLARDLVARWQFRYLFEQQDRHSRSLSGNTLAVVGVDAATNATLNQSIGSSFTSQRLIGLFAGVNLDFKRKLIGDFLLRRDGSSLFGAGNRWATFGRASVAYRPSQEGWWPLRDALNEFKVRASYGTAGGRPSFAAQYETFNIGSGGALTAAQFGNRFLRPEVNTEMEVGADLELFHRVGVTVTYAHSDTKDQILLVPVAAATGFASQWQNAGTLTNTTWELSVNLPVVRSRDFSWSWRFNYDRTRTVVTRLDVPPFRIGTPLQNTTDIFNVAEGERYATMYGNYFLRGTADCDRLPAPFNADCGGPGAAFQVNSDGWLVWTGGYDVGEGLTRNLWMAQRPAAESPWGVALNWGMPIALRDSVDKSYGSVPLGTGLPDWRFSVSQTLQFRRWTVYALLEGVVGRSIWNQGRHWSYLDFITRDLEQRGKSPEEAKPIGYYWRSAENLGIGGLYHNLIPTNATVERGTYAKLRELSVTYHLGRVGGAGNWEVSVIGRNVFTITKYQGFDPETGISSQNYGTQSSSGLVNAIDAFTFPSLRTFTVTLSTTF